MYVLFIGYKLNLNVAHLDNGLHNISWSNPFPGVFTFQVFLNNRQVFETEADTSYTTNRNNGEVCVVAQDKHGNNLGECDSLEEPFEVAWASSGVLRPGTSYCTITDMLCNTDYFVCICSFFLAVK